MTSSLYFVVDASGNYYRVNNENQLVAVADREYAGVFSYAEVNQKIGEGKKSQFYSILPVGDKDMRSTNWEEFLTHFCYLASGAAVYQEELKQAISDLDLQICDIMHCIELHDLDESDSIRMVELLKECREQRRDVKDEMVRVEYFQKTIGTGANVAKVKDGINQIKKLSTRSYHPRKLPEIFRDRGKETLRQNKLHRAMDGTTCMDYVMEEKTMEYTKQDTVFDGQKNNWLDFARQQEAFYANAEQYLVNLQIRQDELQEELEQVLEEVEHANYNVAQGYNVYKRLKELRHEKKNLQKELEAMYILTYGINCNKAAEDMTACVNELEELYAEPVVHEVMLAG